MMAASGYDVRLGAANIRFSYGVNEAMPIYAEVPLGIARPADDNGADIAPGTVKVFFSKDRKLDEADVLLGTADAPAGQYPHASLPIDPYRDEARFDYPVTGHGTTVELGSVHSYTRIDGGVVQPGYGAVLPLEGFDVNLSVYQQALLQYQYVRLPLTTPDAVSGSGYFLAIIEPAGFADSDTANNVSRSRHATVVNPGRPANLAVTDVTITRQPHQLDYLAVRLDVRNSGETTSLSLYQTRGWILDSGGSRIAQLTAKPPSDSILDANGSAFLDYTARVPWWVGPGTYSLELEVVPKQTPADTTDYEPPTLFDDPTANVNFNSPASIGGSNSHSGSQGSGSGSYSIHDTSPSQLWGPPVIDLPKLTFAANEADLTDNTLISAPGALVVSEPTSPITKGGLSLQPATVIRGVVGPGQTIDVGVRYTSSYGEVGFVELGFYLSTDLRLDNADTVLSVIQVPVSALQDVSGYAQATLTLPATRGTLAALNVYNLMAFIDPMARTSDTLRGDNGRVLASGLNLQPPTPTPDPDPTPDPWTPWTPSPSADPAVTAVEVIASSSVYPLSPVTAKVKVTNSGEAALERGVVTAYLIDQDGNPLVRLGKIRVDDLAVGEVRVVEITGTLPTAMPVGVYGVTARIAGENQPAGSVPTSVELDPSLISPETVQYRFFERHLSILENWTTFFYPMGPFNQFTPVILDDVIFYSEWTNTRADNDQQRIDGAITVADPATAPAASGEGIVYVSDIGYSGTLGRGESIVASALVHSVDEISTGLVSVRWYLNRVGESLLRLAVGDNGDVVLGETSVLIGPASKNVSTMSLTIPADLPAGTWELVGVVDAGRAVADSSGQHDGASAVAATFAVEPLPTSEPTPEPLPTPTPDPTPAPADPVLPDVDAAGIEFDVSMPTATVLAGTRTRLSFSFLNTGETTWRNRYAIELTLSRDLTPSEDDAALGMYRPTLRLAAGDDRAGRYAVSIPRDADGAYHVIAKLTAPDGSVEYASAQIDVEGLFVELRTQIVSTRTDSKGRAKVRIFNDGNTIADGVVTAGLSRDVDSDGVFDGDEGAALSRRVRIRPGRSVTLSLTAQNARVRQESVYLARATFAPRDASVTVTSPVSSATASIFRAQRRGEVASGFSDGVFSIDVSNPVSEALFSRG